MEPQIRVEGISDKPRGRHVTDASPKLGATHNLSFSACGPTETRVTYIYKLVALESVTVWPRSLASSPAQDENAEALRWPVSDDLIGHEMIGSAKLMIESATLLIAEAMAIASMRLSFNVDALKGRAQRHANGEFASQHQWRFDHGRAGR